MRAGCVEGEDRRQSFLLPELPDDYVTEDNPIRVVEAFIDELELGALGFEGVQLASTGRPAYHPSTLLNNRVQSSRRLERRFHHLPPAGTRASRSSSVPERGKWYFEATGMLVRYGSYHTAGGRGGGTICAARVAQVSACALAYPCMVQKAVAYLGSGSGWVGV